MMREGGKDRLGHREALGRNSPAWAVPQAPRQCHRHSSGSEWLEFCGVAKVCQTFDQALFLLVGGAAIEVVGTEILIRRPVLEHVVDGGQDGGDDGHDRLLWA